MVEAEKVEPLGAQGEVNDPGLLRMQSQPDRIQHRRDQLAGLLGLLASGAQGDEIICLCRVPRYAESMLWRDRFSLQYATSDRQSLGIIPVVPKYRLRAELLAPASDRGRTAARTRGHAEEPPTDARSGPHGVWRRPTSVRTPSRNPTPERSRSQPRRRIMPRVPSPRPLEYSNSSIDSA
jgi:hypothetical protein